MQCERAQELFSDYTEQALELPLRVALDAHLGGCGACRQELRALQDTFAALQALPAVEPPLDGAEQVIRRLRALRAEQYESQRRRAPSLVEFLRSLSPARMAMGAGIATLILAGSLSVPGIPYIKNALFGIPGGRPKVAPVVVAPHVDLQVSLQGEAGSQHLTLLVTPSEGSAEMQVQVQDHSLGRVTGGTGTASNAQPAELSVSVPDGAAAEVYRVTVQAPQQGGTRTFLVAVPFGEVKPQPVSLTVPETPLSDILLRLAPSTGKPVIVEVENGAEASASLRAEDRQPEACLSDLAGQLHATLRTDGGVYRIVPAD